MTTFVTVVAAILAIGALYVVLPVMAMAYGKYREARTVTCPETGEETTVQPDAKHAALMEAVGREEVRLCDCSRWPERRDCAQTCREQLVEAEAA
jgi:hypothetical protein